MAETCLSFSSGSGPTKAPLFEGTLVKWLSCGVRLKWLHDDLLNR